MRYTKLVALDIQFISLDGLDGVKIYKLETGSVNHVRIPIEEAVLSLACHDCQQVKTVGE